MRATIKGPDDWPQSSAPSSLHTGMLEDANNQLMINCYLINLVNFVFFFVYHSF